MIVFHRSAVVAPGRLADALQFAREVTSHVDGLLPEAQHKVGSGIGGVVTTLHWYSQYDDLAALERAIDRLMGDEGYRLLLAGAGDLFVAGSVQDEIVRTL